MQLVKGPGTLTWGFVAIFAIAPVSLWSSEAPGDVVTLAISGRANSTPWIASHDSFVVVAWGAAAAGKGDVMIAVSRDGGVVFGAPVRVNKEEGEARVSGEIAPRVALQPRQGADPIVAVTWNARGAGAQIKTARSLDGGRTFDAGAALHDGAAAGDRGWQAAAFDGSGTLHAIWIDHRGLAAGAAGPAHKGEHDGVAMAQRSGLYYAASGRGERELLKGVCYCCKTALATGPRGEIYAAWRHVFANNMRDIAFTASRDGGATFTPMLRVHQDRWSINGCPDDGPAMAVDAAGTVHLVWPTVLNGAEGALHYATSADGRRFAPPVRVPTLGSPKPSHPQIAIGAGGGVMIAWDEVVDGARTAVGRRASVRHGRVEFGDIARFGDAAGSYPVIAATPRGWLAAWSTGGPASVIRATLLN